jgi:hypothetical protein
MAIDGDRLSAIVSQYSVLAQQTAEQHSSFTDSLEYLLRAERESRRARARKMFARVADFPAIKKLEQTISPSPPAPRAGRSWS